MKFYTNIERREIHLPAKLKMGYVPFFITSINDMISEIDDVEETIVIYCSSYGGDLNAVTAIVDCINSIDIKVNTLCFGACMQESVLILASGTGERIMSKNSNIMVSDNITKLLSDVTNKEKDFWKKSYDLYLNSNQCLEYGIVDRIV